MATIPQIRDAIAAAVETLTTTSYAVRSTKEWAGPFNVSGNAACAVVQYAGATYDSAFGGQGDALNFKVTMLTTQDRSGRERLDEFSDPTPTSATSVRAAVNGNLGGLVSFATVTTGSEYSDYPVSDSETYLGSEFMVQVMT